MRKREKKLSTFHSKISHEDFKGEKKKKERDSNRYKLKNRISTREIRRKSSYTQERFENAIILAAQSSEDRRAARGMERFRGDN